MFVLDLTGDAHGDWRQLFTHLDEIPGTPAKRLNASYEKSKTFNRVFRATRNWETAILAAQKVYKNAKSWNAFLDERDGKKTVAAPAQAKELPRLAVGQRDAA
jgi:hypothetical protein